MSIGKDVNRYLAIVLSVSLIANAFMLVFMFSEFKTFYYDDILERRLILAAATKASERNGASVADITKNSVARIFRTKVRQCVWFNGRMGVPGGYGVHCFDNNGRYLGEL